MKGKLTKSILRLVMLLLTAFIIVFSAACAGNKKDGDDGSDVDVGNPSAPEFVLDKSSIELTVDENIEILTLTRNYIDEIPQWKSSNPQVATVTLGQSADKVTVKGISAGSAVISVTAGYYIATCQVKVNPGIYLELLTKNLNLLVGGTGTVSVETDAPELSYSSDNPYVATVNPSGLVRGVSEGTTYITVSAGHKSVTCPVTVTAPIVSITKPAMKDEVIQLTLEDGENTYQLEAESNGKIEWFTGDESIAKVDKNGLVTAVGKGETTVTAYYGSAEDERKISVKDEIITVTLNYTEYTLESKESLNLSATVVSSKGEVDDNTVSWSVVDGDDIVSVDENGTVIALGKKFGTAIVRATSNKDADGKAYCSVTVPDPYADWIKISDKASLENALTQGNENKSMYLTGDIDLEGATITSTLNNYNATFDGMGYEIYNFTCNGLFKGIEPGGSVQNLAITCNSEYTGDNGLFGLFILGKVENCRFDITVLSDNQCVLAHHDSTTAAVSNVILLVRNPENKSNVHAALALKYAGWINSYCSVLEGTTASCNGPQHKTEAELKSVSLYEGWDTDIWQIEEGEIPVLKNGGNIGELTVTLNVTATTLRISEKVQLIATVKPSKLPSADRAVVWTSSNESVATVDENGLVTAISNGTAVITATSVKEPEKYVTCNITVNNGAVAEITLTSPENVSLELGGTAKIDASVTIGELTYTSSNSAVATVDANGNITAVTVGTTEIRVQATDSEGIFEIVTVTVNPAPAVSITNKADAADAIQVGGSLSLTATPNRSDGEIQWSSSDESVATVSNGTVTAVAVGKATITVTYNAAGESVSDSVQVTVYDGAFIEFALNARSVSVGGDWKIDYSSAGGTVEWASSNPEIATVDADGNVHGIAVGKTIITATVDGKPTTMVIHVYEKVAGATEVSTEAQFQAMGNGVYYIVNDIDFEGATVNTLSEFVKVDGLGYKVTNFRTPKLFTQFQGYMRNLEISCVLNGNGNFDGLFGTWIGGQDGTVENCIFHITFSGNANQCAFVHHIFNGTAKNIILYVSVENGAGGQKFPAWYENPNGTVNNMFVVKGSGSYSAVNGATEKTEADLKNASTFDESWDDGWVIIDGELPQLKGALVTEPLKIKLDKTTAEISVGETVAINASVTPSELPAEERAVTWSSSDTSVATVDSNGVVTALKAGTAVISVTSADETITVFCTVTVNAIELSITDEITELKLGGEHQIAYTISCGEVLWESLNESVATVDAHGKVTAVSAGSATIKATSVLDPTVSDSITIEVKSSVVITVQLSETSLEIARGESTTIIATVINSSEGVTWSVEEGSDIVSVDENGKVTALDKDGTATIRATAKDNGGKTEYAYAECTITVFNPAVHLSIDTDRRTLKAGETSAARVLHVTMDNLPASPAAADIVWTSSNTAVVDTITAGYSDNVYTGTLNAAGEGVTVITATYNVDGRDYKITCEVAVFTADGNWTAVYDLATFTAVWSSNGNYYLAHDLDLKGADLGKYSSNDYNAVFNGHGFTVSNFTTAALFMYNNSGSVIENLKLICTLNNNGGGEGILGHHGNGGTIRNCYFDITFGTNINGSSPALMNHVNNGIFENIIVVTHNPNNKSGVRADFNESGGTVTNMVSYRADSNIDDPRKGTNVTEDQFTSSATYNESWNAGWIIEDGEYPRLRTAFDN